MSEALDLSLLEGIPEQREAICAELLKTLKTRGGVKLKNHGLSDELIDQLFEYTRKFFALSHEEKMTAANPPEANPNRGYSYVGQESVSTLTGFDKDLPQGKYIRHIKETLDMGSANDDLVNNVWVPEEILSGFRSFMEEFYEHCFKLELKLLTALANALDIPETQLQALHNKAENEFRLLHYPTIPASELADGTATRIAEPTDFGIITLLFQDSVSGLQVEDQQQGTFHGIESANKTEIILNIGEQLTKRYVPRGVPPRHVPAFCQGWLGRGDY